MKPKLRAIIIKGGCNGCWYEQHGVKCPTKTGQDLKCVDLKTDSGDVYIFIPINYLIPLDKHEK